LGNFADITERKGAEQALQESDEFSYSLLDNAPNPILVINPDTSLRYVNPALEKLTGFSQAELVDRKAPYPWWIAEIHQKTSKGLEEAISKEAKGLEELFQKKSGERFWVEMTSTPIRKHGELDYYLANWVDITERKQAEEALRKSEEKYRLLAENVTDVFWTLDMDLRYTYVSPSVTRLRGYSVEEAMAQSVEDVLTPESFEVVIKAKAEELAIEEMEQKDLNRSRLLELELRCKDGSTVWTEMSITGIRDPDGRAVGFLGVTRDITERKRAEEALRESEEKYRALVDHMREGYMVVRGNRIRFANRRCAEVIGVPAEKLIGESYWKFIAPESMEQMRQIYETLPSGGKLPPLQEFVHLGKDGRRVPVEVSFREVIYEGKPSFAVVLRDITERKRAGEALREGEEKYRTILEDIEDGYFEVDIAGNFTFFNDPMCGIIGYSRDEMMGMNNRQYSTWIKRMPRKCIKHSIVYTPLVNMPKNLVGRS